MYEMHEDATTHHHNIGTPGGYLLDLISFNYPLDTQELQKKESLGWAID